MTDSTLTKTLLSLAVVSVFSLCASTASAQSTEEGVGSVIGGTVGAVVGGELDKKGSRTEGQVIGGLVGGTLGYIIGGALEKDNDLRRRYEGRPGEYVTHNGGAYRRHPNDEHGFVSIRISTDDPYYYGDGRKKSHPVFAEHPGRGKGKGLTKQKNKGNGNNKAKQKRGWKFWR